MHIIFTVAPIWLILVLLGGCASPQLPYAPDKMTAEQLKALISDKSASVACSKVVGPAGTGVVTSVNLDKGSAPAGTTVEITADCVVKIGGPAK